MSVENPYSFTAVDKNVRIDRPSRLSIVATFVFLLILSLVLWFTVWIGLILSVFANSTEFWPGYFSAFVATMTSTGLLVFLYRKNMSSILACSILGLLAISSIAILFIIYSLNLPLVT
jgi:hypothetical protein